MIGPVGLFWQPVLLHVDTVLCMLWFGLIKMPACFISWLYCVPVTCDMCPCPSTMRIPISLVQVGALCIRRTRTRTLCIQRSLCRHVTICTPMVFFDVLTVFWLFLTIDTLLVYCWYSLDRPVTIGTPMVIFAVLTVFWLFLTVFDDWYTGWKILEML